MNKFSIPAFIENVVQDTENAKYSKAKLKMYYIGETVDNRLFTKEFSDKIISTIAYTPVVGFYSVADEDFIGHNNVQHIYGLVPADTSIEYIEDNGNTFAVTDIILYTGRPDETGAVAAKIIGKQHSLELDPKTVQCKINRDDQGNFKNLEYTDGELIGLSVLGDNDTPAFTGSEFFSAEELPDFISDDNRAKYEALFNIMSSVEPTAEEHVAEIYRALDHHRIYGYVCEHKPDKYVVVHTEDYVYKRFLCSRGEDGSLILTFDCTVRSRFLSDQEIENVFGTQKGSNTNNDDTQPQNITSAGEQTVSNNNSSALAGNSSGEGGVEGPTFEEYEALRSDYQNLTEENLDLQQQVVDAQAAVKNANNILEDNTTVCKNSILSCYKIILNSEIIADFEQKIDTMSILELVSGLEQAYNNSQTNQAPDVIEFSTIDTPNNYDPTDPVSVVNKYLNR